jgi:general L-amino acid transport system permease protein
MQPPIIARPTPAEWLRRNLFGSPIDTTITVILGLLLGSLAWRLGHWAIAEADWAVLQRSWSILFVGRYPQAEQWRLWLLLFLLCSAGGFSTGALGSTDISPGRSRTLLWAGLGLAIALVPLPLGERLRLLLALGLVPSLAALAKGWRSLRLTAALPGMWAVLFLVGLWLIQGGFGLVPVASGDWGGLLLTLLTALASLICAFPLGVLLALGRQSELPTIRRFCVGYIELFRGVPLITILFFGQVMVPLFFDESLRLDRVLRAIVGLTLFAAAYLAENVRGGLQAVPRGQVEAARSLGLSPWQTTLRIVLPQALKVSIPAVVGQFISLFQDTTLLSIVGLLELLGIGRAVLSNPDNLGRYGEIYLFIGLLYWICCWAMSWCSRRLEQSLHTDHR